MGGDIVLAVHEVVCHDLQFVNSWTSCPGAIQGQVVYVDEIDDLVNFFDILRSVCHHVLFETRGGDRQLPVTDRLLELSQEQRVCVEFGRLVTAAAFVVAAWILLVDV